MALAFFLALVALLVTGFLTDTPTLVGVTHYMPQRRFVEGIQAPRKDPGKARKAIPSQSVTRVERHVLHRYDSGFVTSRQVPWFMVGAVVVAEDSLFYQHRGMDWAEMRAAVHDWLFGGQGLRGASTLTQQLVKNAWLYRDRTALRKLRELIIAHRLEGRLRKDEILDYYLNMAEWGPNIYGIGAACRTYFGVGPAALSPDQAALLTYFLPAPRKRGGAWLRGQADPRRDGHVRWVLWQMQAQGYWSPPVKAPAAPDEREPEVKDEMNL